MNPQTRLIVVIIGALAMLAYLSAARSSDCLQALPFLGGPRAGGYGLAAFIMLVVTVLALRAILRRR
jgi:hypothetical protein